MLSIIFFKNIKTDNASSNVLLYYGIYCAPNNDFDNMIKYYLMAIDRSNTDAMQKLGYYYYNQ